jgi:hypothetical protein
VTPIRKCYLCDDRTSRETHVWDRREQCHCGAVLCPWCRSLVLAMYHSRYRSWRPAMGDQYPEEDLP